VRSLYAVLLMLGCLAAALMSYLAVGPTSSHQSTSSLVLHLLPTILFLLGALICAVGLTMRHFPMPQEGVVVGYRPLTILPSTAGMAVALEGMTPLVAFDTLPKVVEDRWEIKIADSRHKRRVWVMVDADSEDKLPQIGTIWRRTRP
jgi:hypothetical protein